MTPRERAVTDTVPGGRVPPTLLRAAPSRPSLHGKLPASPDRLIGRDAEVAALHTHLRGADTRLLTLTGPGGVGKTRLALAAARAAAPRFADGARFADLSAVIDPALLPAALARTLGVPADHDPVGALVAALGDRDLLLVIDNLEQLRDGVGLLADLLAACPQLVILATSRVALLLRAERRHPVAPLSPPVPASSYDPAALRALAANPAVALFVARARAACPAFTLTASRAPAIAALCARFDGLPLALELAAARVAALDLTTLLARLTDPLALPADAAPDRPARHRDLRATLAWSHALLSPAAQILFHRLGVCVGGVTLGLILNLGVDAANTSTNAPLPDHDATLVALAELVDASLVRRVEADADESAIPAPIAGIAEGTTRYTLLETIRAYARAQLATSGEGEAIAARHSAYFVALAETAAPALYGPTQAAWLRRLGRDHENLRAALGWLAERGDDEAGLRLAGALVRYWQHEGQVREGLAWLTARFADAAVGAVHVRTRALHAGATLLYLTGDYAAAQARASAALALATAHGERAEVARAHNILGLAARGEGALGEAHANFAAALEYWHPLDATTIPDVASGIASAINNLAAVAYDRGDFTAAATGFAEGAARQRATGDTNKLAQSLAALANARMRLGERASVLPLLGESLVLALAQGDRETTAFNLAMRAHLALAERQPARAARLIGAVAMLQATTGLPRPAPERPYHERAIAEARATLGDTAYAIAHAEGAAWSTAQAVAYALANTRPATAMPGADPAPTGPQALVLSRREREVLPLLAAGLDNKAIAAQLNVGPRTVETHVANIIGKLGLHRRAQVAAWVGANGVLLLQLLNG